MYDPATEWLEADGLGGFASGTVGGPRTRRYHALLLAATTPPTGRFVLVNGVEAWVEKDGERRALSSQFYLPDVRHPDGADRLVDFSPDPWPTWRFRLEDGTELTQEVWVVPGAPRVALAWRLAGRVGGVRLEVRPLLSGRDYHALHHQNPAFRFEAETSADRVSWQPYPDVPAVIARSNGAYRHEPLWYRNFLYAEEAARGLDHLEDLASPGAFCWSLSRGEAVLTLRAASAPVAEAGDGGPTDSRTLLAQTRAERKAEGRRRRAFPSRLERSADAYLVRRGEGRTIVAGYPWFTDWGRDTFIALRGLCLATGRLSDAASILHEWAASVSQGMLPNRFPDRGAESEFNSVDASLWYIVAIRDYLETARAAGRRVHQAERATLRQAAETILHGYADGTRYRIRTDADGLLAAGVPGQQLTWMDARVGDWVVTPRIGKPVEVQALWLNALRFAAPGCSRCREMFVRGQAAFERRFWDAERGYLYDVVDVDGRAGEVDATFRPNQIFAIGGLPHALLDAERGRLVVDEVERRLLTPLGLRSLAPDEPGYAGRYSGGPVERDGAYHQGTVWPWLVGPFVEAWVRVRGGGDAVKREARQRFLVPLLHHLDEAGLGHISEVADGDAPHRPGGCPFQAWSVGEALRLDRQLLVTEQPSAPRRSGRLEGTAAGARS
jgi:predicted glycogen debranching enzyme